jgi:acylphosphatase
VKGFKGRRYLISGRVQGVGFRYYAQRAACETGVAGWVRNLDDGRVEACATGSEKQLSDFEGRLRQGPRGSDVRGFEVSEAEPAESGEFYIR